MYVIAGDIGGTKTLLALARVQAGRVELIHRTRYPSRDYPGLAPLLAAFLAEAGAGQAAEAACLGVAGPIDGTPPAQTAPITHLPWIVDAAALAPLVGTERVGLINDFEAAALGLDALPPDGLRVLQPGRPVTGGLRVVLGAGTGFGLALACPDGDGGYRSYPSEAGHAGFAPDDELQQALWEHLHRRSRRVTVETVLSGTGLVAIYDFLCARRDARPAAAVEQARAGGDAAAAVSGAALDGTDPLAAAALELFVACYAACAGNLALTTLPRGGLYLAGGIAPRIADKLTGGGFVRAFCDRPPMQAELAKIPLALVLDPDLALRGAALAAARLAENASRPSG